MFKRGRLHFYYLRKRAYGWRLMKQVHITIFPLRFFGNMRAGDYAEMQLERMDDLRYKIRPAQMFFVLCHRSLIRMIMTCPVNESFLLLPAAAADFPIQSAQSKAWNRRRMFWMGFLEQLAGGKPRQRSDGLVKRAWTCKVGGDAMQYTRLGNS